MATAATGAAAESGSVRFLLDGEIIELDNVDPTRTVLQFLREDLRRTGTKEGCAEGDCGACTVVLAELNSDGVDLALRAVNSCIQFLPTLDGKELITVESLSHDTNDLHPVQRALVDCHASQCGFCTPGFVMSLFALYKTAPTPTRRQIDDALAGNLCRCTGYRPIIAAAQQMYADGQSSDGWLRQPFGGKQRPLERVKRLRLLARHDSLRSSGGGKRFFAPASVAELAEILVANPQATILAGGTDIGLWVTKRYRELGTIVYTGRVAELQEINVTSSHIEIGAAVSFTDAVPVITAHYPLLDELFLRFASPPIRNAATLGGNIANGSAIGDSMPALMAASTTITLRKGNDRREVALEDFYIGYRVNDLQPGEFIETIRIPLPSAGVILQSYKVSKRFDQDISAVCTAYRLELDGDQVSSIRIACGGLAETIRRAHHCEAALAGKVWQEANVAAAGRALAQDFTPITDMRASKEYRLRVCQNLLRRFYLETRGKLDESLYAYGRNA
jgi:xanthine dehydrogenase small subunit